MPEPTVCAKIHPAIGIARLGNSEQFFVGPELPYPVAPPEGGYRDPEGRIKRQAARFRVFGYDAAGNVTEELTAENARIRWTVEVANKKAAWYQADGPMDIPEAAGFKCARRNGSLTGDERKRLIIAPRPQSIEGVGTHGVSFNDGTFLEVPVSLGELQTDAAGRLLALSGLGVSGTPLRDNPVWTCPDNDGWYDDVADGTVEASVERNGVSLPVDSAWWVIAPPNYAPDIVTVQAMYDVIFDALNGWYVLPPKTITFHEHIYPILDQLAQGQWVNYGLFTKFGWHSWNDLTRPALLDKLKRPLPEYRELRLQIVDMFRNPYSTAADAARWPPMPGDAHGTGVSSPREYLSITPTRYHYLSDWANGNFVEGKHPSFAELAEAPLSEQPALIDKAALHFCMGGPFHPGIEMTWPMRHRSMYRGPFRLKRRTFPERDYGDFLTAEHVASPDGPMSGSEPGDITRWMAVPWQADAGSCGIESNGVTDPYLPPYWPARVPNHVLPESQFGIMDDPELPLTERIAAFATRAEWLRRFKGAYSPAVERVVTHFGELGLVEKRTLQHPHRALPDTVYVETLPPGIDPAPVHFVNDDRAPKSETELHTEGRRWMRRRRRHRTEDHSSREATPSKPSI